MANELEAYFRAAASWDIDRAAQTVQRLRIAWVVAGAGWVCAMALCAAIATMMPLKTTEPYVIRVDNSTGIVDIVPMYAGHAEIWEAVTRYFLSHYITVCERFNPVSVQNDYEECGAFHAMRRNQEWATRWNRVNPDSPLNLYKDGSAVEAKVTAITFFTRASGVNSLAQVRYVKIKKSPAGAESVSHWIGTLEYAYASPSRDPKTRQWNPLAFKVIEFQAVAENVADATSLPEPNPRGNTP